MIHELKILPEYFGPVLEGRKTFELRKNDRDFRVGDHLALKNEQIIRQNAEYNNLFDWNKVLNKAIEIKKSEIETLKEKNRNAMRCSPKAIRRAKAEAIKEFAEKTNKMITNIYNKHIFGNNDLNDEEKDAIINFSDDVVSGFANLVKETAGDV